MKDRDRVAEGLIKKGIKDGELLISVDAELLEGDVITFLDGSVPGGRVEVWRHSSSTGVSADNAETQV